MPWFITAIATVKDSQEAPSLRVRTTRTFGFFDAYYEAWKAVRENSSDMHESQYNFLVIEYIEPGIHPHVHKDEWYEWSERRWMPTMKPPGFDGAVNWALG